MNEKTAHSHTLTAHNCASRFQTNSHYTPRIINSTQHPNHHPGGKKIPPPTQEENPLHEPERTEPCGAASAEEEEEGTRNESKLKANRLITRHCSIPPLSSVFSLAIKHASGQKDSLGPSFPFPSSSTRAPYNKPFTSFSPLPPEPISRRALSSPNDGGGTGRGERDSQVSNLRQQVVEITEVFPSLAPRAFSSSRGSLLLSVPGARKSFSLVFLRESAAGGEEGYCGRPNILSLLGFRAVVEVRRKGVGEEV